MAVAAIIHGDWCVQTCAITPVQWESIRHNDDYIIGYGQCNSLDQARQSALNDLVSKISVKVESQFSYVTEESFSDASLTTEDKMEMIIKSYALGNLKNVDEYVEERGRGEYGVYRYMKRGELNAMFRRRADMARKWAYEGMAREKERKIGDALQDYYWALALLRSCPDCDEEKLVVDGREENMMQVLFVRVKDILARVDIRALSIHEDPEEEVRHVILSFEIDGVPMVNFNYRFHDGKSLSDIYAIKDGIGEVVVPMDHKLNRINIFAEYECREEANIHPDLRGVMDSGERVPLKAAEFKVNAKNCPVVPVANPEVEPMAETRVQSSPIQDNLRSQAEVATTGIKMPLRDRCLEAIHRVEQAVASRDLQSIRDCFTSDGWVKFKSLVGYGEARMLNRPELTITPDGEGMICRSLPMSFSFSGNRRTFTEDVVFYFDKEGKVNEVTFGLEKAAVDDIMNRGDWPDQARHVMTHFLETYKTAYALKDLEYLNLVFSDDALIITGSVVRSAGRKELEPTRKVKYTRYSKREYLKQLERCFARNEYVNIHFADNIVRRSHTNPDIYGIQIKQDWFSSTYGDTGYLFLMIDFANPDRPVIHVRTWQPDLDPDAKDGRIGMADFML